MPTDDSDRLRPRRRGIPTTHGAAGGVRPRHSPWPPRPATAHRLLQDGRRQPVRRAGRVGRVRDDGSRARRRRAADGDRASPATRRRASCRSCARRRPGRPGRRPRLLMPNWQVYQVAFDKPGNQRVTVLWNGDGSSLRARVRKNGSSAAVIDRGGARQPPLKRTGWWIVDLPPRRHTSRRTRPATTSSAASRGSWSSKGSSRARPGPAALGEASNALREFRLFPNPANGQTVGRGQAAEYFIDVRVTRAFGPVSIRLTQWSTQRFPNPRDPGTLPSACRSPPAQRQAPRPSSTWKPSAPSQASTSSNSKPPAQARRRL